MLWTKAKIAVVVGVAVLLSAGTTAVVMKALTKPDDAGSAATLAEYDWQKLADTGQLPGGQVIKLDGRTVLKLENTNAGSLAFLLLKIVKPRITEMNYAVTGEIKYENVESAGHLAMWNFFPPLQAGQQEPQYYSFTGDPDPGPAQQIVGTSDWRAFSLPLDRTGATYPASFSPGLDTAVTARPPTRLEINFFIPGRGVVYLSKVKLIQWRAK